MQLSKTLLAACAIALTPLAGFTADNDTQPASSPDAAAQARAELERKQNPAARSPFTKPPAALSAPSTAGASRSSHASAEPLMAQARPAATPLSDTTPASDPEAISKARQAMREKMGELTGQPVPPPPVATPPSHAEPPASAKAVPPPSHPSALPTTSSYSQPRPAPSPQLNTVQGSDPEAIAKAREAMREKMSEMSGAPASMAATPPAAPARSVEPVAPPQTRNAPQFQTPANAAPSAAKPTKAELKQQAAAEAQARKEREQAAKAEAAARKKADQERAAADAQARKSEQELARVQAEEKRKADLAAKQPTDAQRKRETASVKPVNETPPPVQNFNEEPRREQPPAYKGGLRPEAPALPISQDKQHRLSELLRKYKADELTPEQYHQERAKILAE
ncbi:MAG: hypothetical protein C5B50_18870 [Verrucomicrobia bacterium]|nr:MAG: hypothetical protein C5B50_18870 [Verrucomicrobiota bacterium]